MGLSEEHKEFLARMEIDPERLITLGRDVQILVDIADDYETHKNDLLDEASYIANKLQRCDGVHTVRSRIKDKSHVIEKIIRKWECEQVAEKYDTISKKNYKSVISDLVGVRAIYLFKNDCVSVHEYILSKWRQEEPVVIYFRNGDDLTKYENFSDCVTKEHDKGYRSIHYIIPIKNLDEQQVKCEIQTRTIFEEGWSEIDHKVRYPNFSDNPYLKEFLDIFNRISGSADEMGSFVNSLSQLIKKNNLREENRKLIIQTHEKKILELEKKIDQLFKDQAKLQEIEAAYILLKKVQGQKERIEKNDIHISFDDYQTVTNPLMITSRLTDVSKLNSHITGSLILGSQLTDVSKLNTQITDTLKVGSQLTDVSKLNTQLNGESE